ncbi:MAG: zinc ribbon domain-containing protein [Lachnospiraceae bacterium]|nr:zinc ribbon domain-containing protein [Lachnospiraceae bacterium]
MIIVVCVIIVLVLILVISGCAFYFIWKAKRAVESFSRSAFGTSDIRQGFRQVEQEYAAVPKSVSAMTGLYLPKIKKDFPEFQYDEMKVRAENVLTSYLLAVDRMSEGTLKEGNKELKDKLEMRIGMLRGAGEKESFRSIKLHRTEITDYRKRNGRCIITFQTSLQYYYTRKDESGKILAGREDLPTQSKYNTDVIYIQDRELLADERDLALGLNCPNCGAPIPGTGSKVCEYCGTPVVELNIYAWTFGNVTEVR